MLIPLNFSPSSLFLKTNYAKRIKDTAYLIDAIQNRAVRHTLLLERIRTIIPRAGIVSVRTPAFLCLWLMNLSSEIDVSFGLGSMHALIKTMFLYKHLTRTHEGPI